MSQEEPGGAMRSQEEPGEVRRSQEEAGGARGSQEEPGGAPFFLFPRLKPSEMSSASMP